MNFKEPQIRLVIADDHPLFRDGLRRLLEAEPEDKVIGEASDGAEAVTLVRQLKPRHSSTRSGHAQTPGHGSLTRTKYPPPMRRQ